MRNAELVVRCSGIRVLQQSMVDGPGGMADSVILTLIYLADSLSTRKYLRPGVDIEVC